MSEITKKTERLASAVYLVTSFFADQEPMKWRLRTLSANLVSEDVKDKSSTAREMVSLFAVAKNAALVSDQNFDILIGELTKLQDEIEKPVDYSLISPGPSREKYLPEPKGPDPVKDTSYLELNTEPEEKKVEKPVLKGFGAVSVKKNSRQSIIIGLLKRKKEIMIKDVSPLISGCSEKTIQRELSAMVKQGVIKKMGDKRWSRYTLA